MSDMTAFKEAFSLIVAESYPRLLPDDPAQYEQGRDTIDAQDDFRTELSQAIEEALAVIGKEADHPEDLAPYYEATDELLPRLADWITED
jgi:hypothetical protein